MCNKTLTDEMLEEGRFKKKEKQQHNSFIAPAFLMINIGLNTFQFLFLFVNWVVGERKKDYNM